MKYCVLKFYTLGTFFMASPIFLISRKLHPPHLLDHVHQHEADCPEPLAYLPRWWQGDQMSNPDLLTPHGGNVQQKECQRRVSRSSPLHPYLQGTGQLIGYCFSQGSDPYLASPGIPIPVSLPHFPLTSIRYPRYLNS